MKERRKNKSYQLKKNSMRLIEKIYKIKLNVKLSFKRSDIQLIL